MGKPLVKAAQSWLSGSVTGTPIRRPNSPLVRTSLSDRKGAAPRRPPPWPLPNTRLSCDNHLPEGDTGRRSHCYRRAFLDKETDRQLLKRHPYRSLKPFFRNQRRRHLVHSGTSCGLVRSTLKPAWRPLMTPWARHCSLTTGNTAQTQPDVKRLLVTTTPPPVSAPCRKKPSPNPVELQLQLQLTERQAAPGCASSALQSVGNPNAREQTTGFPGKNTYTSRKRMAVGTVQIFKRDLNALSTNHKWNTFGF